jgi:hypothetical protein
MVSNHITAMVALSFAASLGISAANAGNGPPGGVPPDMDASRIQAGFNFAKDQGITLDLSGKNRALVGLGSYLVNAVGGCNDCHTNPSYTTGGNPYDREPKQVNVDCYLAGGRPFGPFVSRDITPYEQGMPAGLTFEEFLNVIRTGEDPDNQGIVLQVMPWPTYQAMTDRDLLAIYTYLSAIPAISSPNSCGG